jgi:hypothetical protein
LPPAALLPDVAPAVPLPGMVPPAAPAVPGLPAEVSLLGVPLPLPDVPAPMAELSRAAPVLPPVVPVALLLPYELPALAAESLLALPEGLSAASAAPAIVSPSAAASRPGPRVVVIRVIAGSFSNDRAANRAASA